MLHRELKYVYLAEQTALNKSLEQYFYSFYGMFCCVGIFYKYPPNIS